jgi:hypothetical protein
MDLTDFQRRLLGFPAQMFGGQAIPPAQPMSPVDEQQQQDMQQASTQRLGQLGMLLMAAGQRMTPKERATILAQAPQYMDGVQRDAMTAAQARLMNMQGRAAQDELSRTEALRQKFNDPSYLKSIGLSPEQAQALGPSGIQKLLENQALANTPEAALDRKFKQAQIDHLLNPTPANPQMVDLPGGGKGWAFPGKTDVLPIDGAGKGTAEEPKKTEAEVKGYQFAQQSIDAYKKLADPEYQYALTSRAQQLANKLPYFSSPWSSNDYRSADAASSAMTDAILRNKSGATIHDPEIQDEIRRVIPQPGDTTEQLKDKVARQRLMIEGFIGAANPADRKALKELYDKTNNELMSKYTQSAPGNSANGASAPGVKSIRQIN